MRIRNCFLLVICLVISQQATVAQQKYSITKPYDFPVKPGTPQWADLHGIDEQTAACVVGMKEKA